jgi:hypothetical protein
MRSILLSSTNKLAKSSFTIKLENLISLLMLQVDSCGRRRGGRQHFFLSPGLDPHPGRVQATSSDTGAGLGCWAGLGWAGLGWA